jgi:hypothetical protein
MGPWLRYLDENHIDLAKKMNFFKNSFLLSFYVEGYLLKTIEKLKMIVKWD